MKCSRGVPVVLATWIAVVLGAVGWLVPSAHAQTLDRLRPDVTTAENLTDAQRQQIRQFLDQWTSQLTTDEGPRVTVAQQRLLEPLRAGTPSNTFAQFYSSQAAERLAPALEDEQPFTRVNAMIVVAQLNAGEAMPLIERAMADENAAVRYRAMKAIQGITLTDSQARQVIDRLVAHVSEEQVPQVVEQAMLALVRMDLAEARTRGLTLLNDRVEFHLNEPGTSLQATHSTLRHVYQHLASTSDATDDELRQLARTAVLYQDLASRQLAEEQVSESVRGSYERVLQLCNAALRFAADSLDVNGSNVPRAIDPLIDRDNWAAIQRNVEEWRTLLQRAPFNFPAEDVTLAG